MPNLITKTLDKNDYNITEIKGNEANFYSISLDSSGATFHVNGKINLNTGVVKLEEDNSNSQNQSSINWQSSFDHLKTSIIQGNKAEVKKHFSFPILNRNNCIWGLTNDPQIIQSVGVDTKAFHENDFDNYFSKIFSRELTVLLLNVPVKDLKDNVTFTTSYVLNKRKFELNVNFDSKNKTLGFSFNRRKLDVDDGGSSNIFYFKLNDRNELIFDDLISSD